MRDQELIGQARPRCRECHSSWAGADGLCSGCRELAAREAAAYERLLAAGGIQP
jgi:hypothetical protein